MILIIMDELKIYKNDKKIEIDSMKFQSPSKIDDVYLSKSIDEYIIKLPIISGKFVTKDKEENVLKLTIDERIKSHKIISKFLKEIDEFIVKQAFEKCEDWFLKKINHTILDQLFINTIQNNTIHFSCDTDILEKINSNCNMILKLHGIEFYKNNFMCNYQVIKSLEDKVETVSKVDFISYIENKGNLTKIINELDEYNLEEQEDVISNEQEDEVQQNDNNDQVNSINEDNLINDVKSDNSDSKSTEKKKVNKEKKKRKTKKESQNNETKTIESSNDIYDVKNINNIK